MAKAIRITKHIITMKGMAADERFAVTHAFHEPLLGFQTLRIAKTNKRKPLSAKDFRLFCEGWRVGLEPTTFRTTI